MNDLIDRNDLLEKIPQLQSDDDYYDSMYLWAIREVIENQPRIDTRPLVRAHWDGVGNHIYECSYCNKDVRIDESYMDYDYCPYCGAEMDLGETT